MVYLYMVHRCNRIPQLERCVAAATQHSGAVRGEGAGANTARVPAQRVLLFPRVRVPDLERIVGGAAHDHGGSA